MNNPEETKTPFSEKQLDYFKELLLEKRSEAQEKFERLRSAQSNLSEVDDADMSAMRHHESDFASDVQESEMNYTLIERTREYIQHINDALERIENKTYGICLATGKPIAKGRLEAVPHTRYSIEAKQQGLAKDE